MPSKNINIKLDEALWKAAKVEAAKRGITLRKLVEGALTISLQQHSYPWVYHDSEEGDILVTPHSDT